MKVKCNGKMVEMDCNTIEKWMCCYIGKRLAHQENEQCISTVYSFMERCGSWASQYIEDMSNLPENQMVSIEHYLNGRLYAMGWVSKGNQKSTKKCEAIISEKDYAKALVKAEYNKAKECEEDNDEAMKKLTADIQNKLEHAAEAVVFDFCKNLNLPFPNFSHPTSVQIENTTLYVLADLYAELICGTDNDMEKIAEEYAE